MMMLLLAACLPLAADRDHITAADLAAAEPGFSAVAADTPVGYAPSPGIKRMFGVAELTHLAQRYGLPIQPQNAICFERAVEPLTPAAVLDAMRGSLDLPAARLEVVELSHYPVPPGVLEFARTGLVAPPPSQPQGPALWKGSVRYGGNRRLAIWARVRILVKMERVVAAEALHAGQPIEAAQLRLEPCEGFPSQTLRLAAIEPAVGRVPRRSLAAGTVILAADLDAPYDVKRGDTVHVAVSRGEAHIELDGRAEANGRRGQTIPVLNPTNGKRFSARVEGAGRVEVGTNP
jgi:flagella basal body P-ring formation protein FlgA